MFLCGSWSPLTNLAQTFQVCHLCNLIVPAIFFSLHTHNYRCKPQAETLTKPRDSWVQCCLGSLLVLHVLYTSQVHFALLSWIANTSLSTFYWDFLMKWSWNVTWSIHWPIIVGVKLWFATCFIHTPLKVAPGKVLHTPLHSPRDDSAHLHRMMSPLASATRIKSRALDTVFLQSVLTVGSHHFTWYLKSVIAAILKPNNWRHSGNRRSVDQAIVCPSSKVAFDSYFPRTSTRPQTNPTSFDFLFP